MGSTEDKLDIDLSGLPTESKVDHLAWPDDIDQTWVVKQFTEHDRRISQHDRRINDHSKLLIAHDGVHKELRTGILDIHSQVANQVELNKAHLHATAQLYQQIVARQTSIASIQKSQIERQEAKHPENIELATNESKRSDWRMLAVLLLGLIVLAFLFITPKV